MKSKISNQDRVKYTADKMPQHRHGSEKDLQGGSKFFSENIAPTQRNIVENSKILCYSLERTSHVLAKMELRQMQSLTKCSDFLCRPFPSC